LLDEEKTLISCGVLKIVENLKGSWGDMPKRR